MVYGVQFQVLPTFSEDGISHARKPCMTPRKNVLVEELDIRATLTTWK